MNLSLGNPYADSSSRSNPGIKKLLIRNLIAVLLYLLSGVLGILLTSSSGFASPIWPAAGTALAVLLVWGWRCCPGIWLGGFLIDIWFDISISGFFLSATTASIATVQAIVGAILVKPHFRAKFLFTSDIRLALFLIVIGPMACSVFSGMGILAHYFSGRVAVDSILNEWIRWWVGDTLGVLLFMPLSLLLWPRVRRYLILGTNNYRFALPLMVTSALLVFGYIGLVRLQEQRDLNQAKAIIEVISNEQTLKFIETIQPLKSLADFFSASEEVTRNEFHQYSTRVLNHSALQSVDWIPLLKADQRIAFEIKVRDEGIKEFQIQEQDQQGKLKPASLRSEYYPVLFSEPLTIRRNLLGLDYGFDSNSLSAMLKARELGVTIALGMSPLIQPNNRVFLVYIPVWRMNSDQQLKQLAGFVVGSVNIDNIFSNLLENSKKFGLLTRISDITSNGQMSPLIDNIPSDKSPIWHHDFSFNDRIWRLEVLPKNAYLLPRLTSEEHFFLVLSVLMSLLAVFATLSSANRHNLISRQVNERTTLLRKELSARSAAEAALYSSEERYRRLIELSPFGILVQSEGRCLFVNSSTIKMFGASSSDQLLGQKILDFIHEDSKSVVIERLTQRSEGVAIPDTSVVHYRRLDGSYSWVELTSVYYDYEGSPGSLILLNDISARMRAEEQMDRFFNLSLDLFCIATTEGYFKSVNPAFTKILGWSEQELLSRPIIEFVHPEDIDFTVNELKNLSENNRNTMGFENRYLCKNGTWRWFAWKAIPQPGQLLFATARDITEHHNTAQKLSQLNIELQQRIEERGHALNALEVQKEEIRAVLDHLLECVITIDSRGTIRRVNPAVRALLGYEPDEILGQNVSCLMESSIKEQHDEYLARYQKTGRRNIIGSSREVTGRHKLGYSVSLELSVSEYYINGEPLFVGSLRDIRERKSLIASLTQAREGAEQASRAKSAFLATMSHEIRTPMNGVIGLADILAREEMTPYQSDLVNTIRESATSLLTIIDDVLDFSKIEADKLDIDPIPTDIKVLLEEQFKTLLPLATAKGVDLNIDSSIDVTIYTDPVRLRQIILNLVGNAIKFSAKEHQATGCRGQVDIRVQITETPASQIVIDITDNGIGIAATHLPKLFMPFTQMESSTTRRFGGSGLGLAISKRLVELMGGSIHVESTLDIGSLFRVCLPALIVQSHQNVDSPSISSSVMAVEDKILGSYLILVAEDDEINRKVIQHQLNLLGYPCEVANNGREALGMWRSKTYDLLLTDLHMPDMDGYELTEHIRREEHGFRRFPILTLTANALRDEADRAFASGVDEYLTKPIRLDVLESVLSRWLPNKVMPATEVFTESFSDVPVFDVQMLSYMVGDDSQLITDTLKDYIDALGNEAIQLEDICKQGDHTTIVSLAHRLKSSSRTVGAERLAASFEALEAAAKIGDVVGIAEAAATLSSLRYATKNAIEQQLIRTQNVGANEHENFGH